MASHSRTSSTASSNDSHLRGSSTGNNGSGSGASQTPPLVAQVNRGRGYKLTASTKDNSTAASTTASATTTNNKPGRSSSSSPPPPNSALINATMLSASNNSPPMPTSSTSSRNALRVTPGWGVGLSHSGSYLSTSVRTSSTIPLLTEEPSTYDAIKSILHTKKLIEIAAAKDAFKARKLKESSQSNNSKAELLEEKTKLAIVAKEQAASQLQQSRDQLEKLLQQRSQVESDITSEWKMKIENFKKKSLQEEKDEIKKMKEDHEKEVERLMEEVRMENEKDEEKLAELIKSTNSENADDGKGKKRKIDSVTDATKSESDIVKLSNEGTESSTKKQKTNYDGGRTNEAELHKGETERKISRTESKESESDLDNELFGYDDDEEEELVGEKKDENEDLSLSVKKKEELKKILDEVSDLNKTKSQMIWLLKQVITAENKRSTDMSKKTGDAETSPQKR